MGAKLQHGKSRALVGDQIVVADADNKSGAVFLSVNQKGQHLRGNIRRVLPAGIYDKGATNATDDAVVYPDQPEKCSIANSSKCPELREKFMNIAGGIADAREEMELMIANKQSTCKKMKKEIKGEID